MNLQSKLEQFRDDNPYDTETQARRLLATSDNELILYTLALGLATARQRQRHQEREFIKNMGQAPASERLVPGRTTGSVVIIPSKKMKNAMKQMILDVWMVGDKKLGDCSSEDLTIAIKRENASSTGHRKNAQLYGSVKKKLSDDSSDTTRDQWDERTIRAEIEKVYGEFRKEAAA